MLAKLGLHLGEVKLQQRLAEATRAAAGVRRVGMVFYTAVRLPRAEMLTLSAVVYGHAKKVTDPEGAVDSIAHLLSMGGENNDLRYFFADLIYYYRTAAAIN